MYAGIIMLMCGEGDKALTSTENLSATGAQILEIDYVDESAMAKAAEDYESSALDCLVSCAGK